MKFSTGRFLSIAVLLTGSSILAKILGFGKDLLVSYYYGTSEYTDAFFLALSVPYLLITVLTSASDGAIIPQYNRIFAEQGRGVADRAFGNITNICTLFAVIIGLLSLIFADLLISMFAPGFQDTQRDYAILYLRVFSFIGVFNLLFCYFSSYTTRYGNVIARSIVPVISNVILILSLIFYYDEELIAYAYTFLIVNIIGAILPILTSIKLGYKHNASLNTREPEFKRFYLAAIPIAGTALLFDLYMFAGRFIASGLGTGSISALNYASRITAMFDSLIVVGLGAVLLTYLSGIYVNKEIEKLKSSVDKTIFTILIVLLPIVVIAMTLSTELITLIYLRGEFDASSVKLVSSAFLFLAPQILLLSLHAILTKIFYSIESTRIPTLATFIGFVVNIILSSLLSRWMGVNGIALSMSVAMSIACILLVTQLYSRLGRAGGSSLVLLRKLLFVFIAACIAAMVVVLCKQFISSALVLVIVSGILGIAAYIVVLQILIPKEINELKQIITRKKTGNA